jgi:hypothetical protein
MVAADRKSAVPVAAMNARVRYFTRSPPAAIASEYLLAVALRRASRPFHYTPKLATGHGSEQGVTVPYESHRHVFSIRGYDLAAPVVGGVVEHQNRAVTDDADREFSVIAGADRVRALVVGDNGGTALIIRNAPSLASSRQMQRADDGP